MSWHHSLHKEHNGTNQSSLPHAPNASSLNQHVKRNGGLVRINYFKPFRLSGDIAGKKENIYSKPRSSDKTSKKVIFVKFCWTTVTFIKTMKWKLYSYKAVFILRTMLCCISKEDLDCAITPCLPSSSSSVLSCTVVVLFYPHINSINPPSSKSKYHRRNNTCKKKISRNSVQLTCETFFTRKNIKH